MATAYGNADGQGDRRSTITVSVTSYSPSGTANTIVDGVTGSGGWFAFVNPVTSSHTIVFDFGRPVIIDEFKSYHGGNANYGTHQWQGWDGSTWQNIGSSFSWTATNPYVGTSLAGNTTAYSKYRIQGVSGTWFATDLREIEFKIDEPAPGIINFSAAFEDDAGMAASLGHRTNFAASFADDLGMAVTLTAEGGSESEPPSEPPSESESELPSESESELPSESESEVEPPIAPPIQILVSDFS